MNDKIDERADIIYNSWIDAIDRADIPMEAISCETLSAKAYDAAQSEYESYMEDLAQMKKEMEMMEC